MSTTSVRSEVQEQGAKSDPKALIAPLLLEAVKKVVTSPEGQRYFKGFDPELIQLDTKPVVENATGWVIWWHYSRDIIQVENPNKSSAAAIVHRAANANGVEINLVVAGEGGGVRISAKRGFPIFTNPATKPLYISYKLITFEEDRALEELLEKVCLDLRENVWAVLDLPPMVK